LVVTVPASDDNKPASDCAVVIRAMTRHHAIAFMCKKLRNTITSTPRLSSCHAHCFENAGGLDIVLLFPLTTHTPIAKRVGAEEHTQVMTGAQTTRP